MRAVILGVLLAGCATVQPRADAPVVAASAETDPVDTAADAADDPAIWRNRRDPAKSLVIGTDKKAGIHVYAMSGRRLSFTPAARLNNVDLREVGGRIIAAASDRADVDAAHVSLFALDTAAAKLVPIGRFPVGPGEAYGMCLWTRARDKALFGFVVMKDGRIDQVAIDARGTTPTVRTVRSMKLGTQAEGCVVDDRTGLLYVAEEDVGLWRFDAEPTATGTATPIARVDGTTPTVRTVRSMKLGTQAEGCVVDDRTGLLYVAEEDVGLWRFDAEPTATGTATPIARVDGTTLVADAEGLALAPGGRNGGYLVVSSQGDNAYTLYRLPGVTYAGRFRIGGGVIDATSDTDGIELTLGDFGPGHRQGLFVAQDGDNAPHTQNFKYVDWAAVKKALRLR